jgi:hypothetical protein
MPVVSGGRPFPRNGRIISFGCHEVYVETERACRYPEQELVTSDPPSHMLARAGRSARPVESAEVMMTGPAVPPAGGADKGAAADVPLEPERTKRSARPPVERAENLAGTFSVSARDQPLIPIINQLLEPMQSAMIQSKRRRSWKGRVRPSSARSWPCSRSGIGSTMSYVSMRLPKVLLLS